MLLKLENLNVYYGGIYALKGINLNVEENKIITLIGANGAGKSLTLRAVSGLVNSSGGSIFYKGEDVTSIKTTEKVKKGITLVPEGRRVFANLTVYENLLLGVYLRNDKKEIENDIEYVYSLFPRLKERVWQHAGTLSGGEQQMFAIGRALMARPELIMMDEPSLGLAPLVIKDVFNIIQEIHKQGVTILLIEQNANAALNITDYGYVLETGKIVLETGKIVLEGPGKELAENEEVKKVYLGS